MTLLAHKNYKNALCKVYAFIKDPGVKFNNLMYFTRPSDKIKTLLVKNSSNIAFKTFNQSKSFAEFRISYFT